MNPQVSLLLRLLQKIEGYDLLPTLPGAARISDVEAFSELRNIYDVAAKHLSDFPDLIVSEQNQIEFLVSKNKFLKLSQENSRLAESMKNRASELKRILDDEDFNSDDTSDIQKLDLKFSPETIEESGLYGKVFKAKDNLDRSVAVKYIALTGSNVKGAFAHAKVQSKIDHPNVVPVFAFGLASPPGSEAPLPAFTMPWIDGEKLWEKFEKGIEIDEAVLLIEGVGSGVQYLHDKNVAHRDLHYDNILVTSSGEPKIIDINPNQDNTLSRMTAVSREAAIRSDVISFVDIAYKVIASTSIPVSRRCYFENHLKKLTSIAEVKTETVSFLKGDNSDVEDSRNDTANEPAIELNQALIAGNYILARRKLSELASALKKNLDSFFSTIDQTQDSFVKNRSIIEATITPLCKACFSAMQHQERSISEAVGDCIESIAEESIAPQFGIQQYQNEFRRYPVLVLYYSSCLGAYSEGNWNGLSHLLLNLTYREGTLEDTMLSDVIRWKSSYREKWKSLLNQAVSSVVPISRHLEALLWKKLPHLSPSRQRYNKTFYEFEYLAGLVMFSLAYDPNKKGFTPASKGAFIHERTFVGNPSPHAIELANEAKTKDREWPVFKAGLFDRNKQKFLDCLSKFDEMIHQDLVTQNFF